MNENPYQSPKAPVLPGPAPAQVFVDRDCLVVRSGAVLAGRCVKTNRPVSDSEIVPRNLYWSPSWIVLLILVSPLILVLAYFLVRKRCRLTFGMHSEIRRRYRRRTATALLLMIGSFLALPFLAATDFDVLIIGMVLLFLGAISFLFVGCSPLKIIRRERDLFWVRGCSQEYLAQTAAEQAAQQSAGYPEA
jgi:hypothetical protein